MTMSLSLSLQASLDDPDDHKEKPLICYLEPDINLNQQINANNIYKPYKNKQDLWYLIVIEKPKETQHDTSFIQPRTQHHG